MSTRLDRAVGLLERSLIGTREALGRVRPADLARPTPCAAWDLGALLRHMDDSLGCYLEASRGLLGLSSAAVGDDDADPAASLRARACTLLGAWSAAAEQGLDEVALDARVGRPSPAALPADLLVSTAALEIAAHGWDVNRSLGHRHDLLDEPLAAALVPVARCTVGAGREAHHFAAPVVAAAGAGSRDLLLAMLGRDPGWTARPGPLG
ncbi:hypothetical protein I601_1152 [Nocardioides dokdonensis FR1436]|uniref:Mycothiol-dependent maleylpyruvate isomerase metal-binding domain-containing protein n=1 Tax=Nocardioides dokdonensis FR1436 TaxID=1300347 RepID=A0A1A9GH79_9ACTN|nr:maleylpyruvate isomerase N-terminal domain-containing protein [Nocardioides dokdonensis]ANH37594.1 hypothetical protein I601_1152 [Nocardioides dokdonensis FR1436]